MSSPVINASANPPTASKAPRRTARLALRPAGRKENCCMEAGTGGQPLVTVERPEVEDAGHHVDGLEGPGAAGQPARCTTSSASQKASSSPRAALTPGVAGRRCAGLGRGIDPSDPLVASRPTRRTTRLLRRWSRCRRRPPPTRRRTPGRPALGAAPPARACRSAPGRSTLITPVPPGPSADPGCPGARTHRVVLTTRASPSRPARPGGRTRRCCPGPRQLAYLVTPR